MAKWKWTDFQGEAEYDHDYYWSNNEYGINPPFFAKAHNMAFDTIQGISGCRGCQGDESLGGAIVGINNFKELAFDIPWQILCYDGKIAFRDAFGEQVGATGITGGYFDFEDSEVRRAKLMGNGTGLWEFWGNSPIKFYTIGNPAPTTNLSGAQGAAGNVPDGTYYYVFTNVNDSDPSNESNGSPVSAGVVVSSGPKQVDLSSIDAGDADYNCTDRYVYRGTSSDGPFYYIGNVGDRTTLTFVDNVANPDTSRTPPIDHYMPTSYSASLREFFGHLFTFDNGVVKWSKQNIYDLWPDSNFKQLQETPRRLGRIGRHLYVFTERRVYRITYTGRYTGLGNARAASNGAIAFAFEEVYGSPGIHRNGIAMAEFDNFIAYYNPLEGLMIFDGNTAKRVLGNRFNALTQGLGGINWTWNLYWSRGTRELFISKSRGYPGDGLRLWVYTPHNNAIVERDHQEIVVMGPEKQNKDEEASLFGQRDPNWYLFRYPYGFLNGYNPGPSPTAANKITNTIETGWINMGTDNDKYIGKEGVLFTFSSGLYDNIDKYNKIRIRVYLDFNTSKVANEVLVKLPDTNEAAYMTVQAGLGGTKFKHIKFEIVRDFFGEPEERIEASFALHSIEIPDLMDKGNQ